jgi:hypothetical protein
MANKTFVFTLTVTRADEGHAQTYVFSDDVEAPTRTVAEQRLRVRFDHLWFVGVTLDDVQAVSL